MTLHATASRIAELLIVAEAFQRRGSTEAEAAVSIGVPLNTLHEWRRQLARVERRHHRQVALSS